jgi:ribonuclease VapC
LASIGAEESHEAIMAAHRYGRGRHPARLNMGDCFAYACAKTNAARLLYKGDDFSKTDLA